MILFLSFFSLIFRFPLSGRAFILYSLFLHYPDHTLVHHLSLHLSTCPISHLLWLSVNGGGWNCTIQRFSPHKCGQKSYCSAFNAVVATFISKYFCILIIFACAWSSSLSLDPPGESPRLPKYLLDRYSLYPRSVDSLNYIPSSFPYVILHSKHLLLIYSSLDISMSWNRAQGPLYQFGLLSPHRSLLNGNEIILWILFKTGRSFKKYSLSSKNQVKIYTFLLDNLFLLWWLYFRNT